MLGLPAAPHVVITCEDKDVLAVSRSNFLSSLVPDVFRPGSSACPRTAPSSGTTTKSYVMTPASSSSSRTVLSQLSASSYPSRFDKLEVNQRSALLRFLNSTLPAGACAGPKLSNETVAFMLSGSQGRSSLTRGADGALLVVALAVAIPLSDHVTCSSTRSQLPTRASRSRCPGRSTSPAPGSARVRSQPWLRTSLAVCSLRSRHLLTPPVSLAEAQQTCS
eukprot:768296-Hanusia_phi.AAC.1